MIDVEVIEEPAAAAAALGEIRSRLLAELGEPASAAALAGRVGQSRQKVNYHLRILESHGLVRPAGERTWGGITERLLVATAGSYAVSPGVLGGAGSDPQRTADRLSAGYLIALAGRVVREVGRLARGDRPVATLAIDTQIDFASAERRAAFADDLTAAVTELAARYHDPGADGARPHRLMVGAHPIPEEER